MLSIRSLVFLICTLLLEKAFAQGNSSIPGITDGQQTCLANCIFFGIPAASNCDPNDLPDSISCFCASTAYTSNVTQCASTQCSICTTGGCNITANPLVDQCNSTTVPGFSSAMSQTGGSSASQTPSSGTPSAPAVSPSQSSGADSARMFHIQAQSNAVMGATVASFLVLLSIAL
ncbi:hypothetical protein FB45DRAFT_1060852 [Roridomyces roridus]|uniref:Extracellular membrane protein CFEM domain-containing protein n=1 Tax=Roridomyces roridus TaxID=1738132 RepID=A0AAD7FHM8_9AGAR|nr:hypothetical protein FB45DRAFT_1060852 [Roridomyces roridus]